MDNSGEDVNPFIVSPIETSSGGGRTSRVIDIDGFSNGSYKSYGKSLKERNREANIAGGQELTASGVIDYR